MNMKQDKIKIEPRITLNYNIYMKTFITDYVHSQMSLRYFQVWLVS